METVSYERLYFDTNHNGDLTDDPVTESRSSRNLSISYVNTVFPSVGLTIEADGVKLEYAFAMSVYSNATTQYSYANASLTAAAYREGEMAIDGKKYRVVVVDYNSNGRFDDQAGIDDKIRLADGSVYPSVGDMLYLIDPDAKPERTANPYDATSNDAMYYVAKQVNLGGRFLDLKITPAGDELTLEPSSIPVGYVTNVNQGYRAIVYGEQGFLKVVGDESGKAPLPVGQWKLASYTIDKTGVAEPQKEEAPETGSLFDALRRAITGTSSSSSSAAPVYHGQCPRQTRLSGDPSHGGPDSRTAVWRTVPSDRYGWVSAGSRQSLAEHVAGRQCRRGLHQHAGQWRATRQAEVHDSYREGRSSRHWQLRIWLRFHLFVLVASTNRPGRQV